METPKIKTRKDYLIPKYNEYLEGLTKAIYNIKVLEKKDPEEVIGKTVQPSNMGGAPGGHPQMITTDVKAGEALKGHKDDFVKFKTALEAVGSLLESEGVEIPEDAKAFDYEPETGKEDSTIISA